MLRPASAHHGPSPEGALLLNPRHILFRSAQPGTLRMRAFAVTFLVLGVLALVYGGVGLAYPEAIARFRVTSFSVGVHDPFVAPALGIVATLCGAGLLVAANRRG
ncbi:MAG: hypothetical protein Q8P41_12245 [Pseudomonadota bacterium]|nr:hypothetical protein [Pseudomonadota bacterium]